MEDVEPGVVNPGGSPVPLADTSASGHPIKKTATTGKHSSKKAKRLQKAE